jgi:hypothetical protein
MIVTRADGTNWHLQHVSTKLTLRSRLPGAYAFDMAANGLRKAKTAGLSALDRLALALPASWCVNSPAESRVFRRWLLPPQREVWLTLLDVMEEPRDDALSAEQSAAIVTAIVAIAPEPYRVEAISKVLALIAPEAVPLMPAPARAFVLGEPATSEPAGFVAMLNWFGAATTQARVPLDSWARAHDPVPLTGPQVLDRLLWFDSEGYRHFPPLPG